MAMTPAPLTDQQKTHPSDKRSAHLKSSKQDNNIYLPSGSQMTVQMSGNQDTLSPMISHQTRIGSPMKKKTIEGSDVTNMKLSYAKSLSHSSDPSHRYL